MKIFIRNNTERLIREYKPGLGEYIFNPKEETEIVDVVDIVETPTKLKIPYTRFPAKQIAEAIIKDFGSTGLELIEKEGYDGL